MTPSNDRKQPLLAIPPLELVARLGYAANGLMYVAVGILALQAALRGGRGADVDRREALLHVLTRPFGRILLVVIALGLAGYALGHLLMALRDPQREQRPALAALVNRLGHALTTVIHFSLALAALELAFTGFLSRGNAPDDWTARLMAFPFGQALVGAVGLVVIGYALYALYKGYTASFRRAFIHPLSENEEQPGLIAGKIGYLARAVIYLLIGFFLLEAAWTQDPAQAGGLGEALATLAGQRFGPWLLASVAIGLVAFGLYGVFLARYRDFKL